ncbi:MAG TPA: hypothetical protein VLV78_23045 [Thermoanaerobaculia bacterium]|nr:hypothetical protein [Thermoanaerobaculia bacterium]
MPLQTCPEWEYENHPRRAVLPQRIAEVLRDLGVGRIDTLAVARDSREVHQRIFVELTPQGFEYYAGHYRGELYYCLRSYEVSIRSDPRVGAPSHAVGWLMRDLRAEVEVGLKAIDANVSLKVDEKLRYIVALACHVFELSLRVHPYANGNGHAARFVVWSMFLRYGHWPRKWPIEPRPPDPPYTDLITRYRSGDKLPFEQYMLTTLIP